MPVHGRSPDACARLNVPHGLGGGLPTRHGEQLQPQKRYSLLPASTRSRMESVGLLKIGIFCEGSSGNEMENADSTITHVAFEEKTRERMEPREVLSIYICSMHSSCLNTLLHSHPPLLHQCGCTATHVHSSCFQTQCRRPCQPFCALFSCPLCGVSMSGLTFAARSPMTACPAFVKLPPNWAKKFPAVGGLAE